MSRPTLKATPTRELHRVLRDVVNPVRIEPYEGARSVTHTPEGERFAYAYRVTRRDGTRCVDVPISVTAAEQYAALPVWESVETKAKRLARDRGTLLLLQDAVERGE